MAAYVIVQENIHDPASFEEYRKVVPGTLEPFGGRFLVRGGHLTVLEGQWPYQRTVILEFPNRESAESWYRSEAYQSVLPVRARASTCNFVIVDGV
ncbi:MAG TPA: DUF1330 domain-containing protein [Candidatus Limnocylindrales bacterium]|nr:DUF1330 domain-containing protein [Candidatus Limnocylindrales bacterium]